MSDDTTTTVDESTAMAIPSLGMQLSELDLLVRTAIENIEDTDDPGHMIAMHGAICRLSAFAREWKRMIDQRFIEHLQANGTDGKPAQYQSGTVRYYAASKKKTVQKVDHATAIERLFEASGGDMAQVAECLSSGALKPGQIGQLWPELRDELFTVEYDDELREGKPQKQLAVVDEKYLK